MPYNARGESLPECAIYGGLTDPRSKHQPCFGQTMTYRDVADFASNMDVNALESSGNLLVCHSQRDNIEHAKQEPANPVNGHSVIGNPVNSQANGTLLADTITPKPVTNGNGHQHQGLSSLDFLPANIGSGGLSRSPALDCLPVVSHWAQRTGEHSASDPAANLCLTSTWNTTFLVGHGTTCHAPLGAQSWSLKSHVLGPTIPGSSPKFAQSYSAATNTLTTTVNLARRSDTPRTDGVISAVTAISWIRNARVADAVDCAVGLLSSAEVLLTARDAVIATGQVQDVGFAEVQPAEMPAWCLARKPLPPKLSGVAYSDDTATVDVVTSEGCQGPLVNTSIFSMAVGYNRGVYGGSVSGLWAIMDSAFVLDYSIGKSQTAMGDSLASAFQQVHSIAEASTAGPHITDIQVVKSCNYMCLRQKTMLEDAHPQPSRPCVTIWKDLAQLARYKLADAVFCHVYYDSGGGEQMAAIAGLGCVAHDWIDLGADIACGEISNIIPSLTRGSLNEKPLAEVYARLVGAMIWYRDNDPYNPAALCLLFTHWWQLANCRHRPISLLGRTDLDVEAGIVPLVPHKRPELEWFEAGGANVTRGRQALDGAEARLQTLLSSSVLPETQKLTDVLVRPVLDYVAGSDMLPAECDYLGAVLAAEIAYPHGQKIMELWDLAIVMWESGAMWAAGVAGLSYSHAGNANCDRAREDLSNTTWS